MNEHTFEELLLALKGVEGRGITYELRNF